MFFIRPKPYDTKFAPLPLGFTLRCQISQVLVGHLFVGLMINAAISFTCPYAGTRHAN